MTRLRYSAIAFLVLGGVTLVAQAVTDAGRGGAMGAFDVSVAILVTAIGLLEAFGLYFDRPGAWVFALPAAALLGVTASELVAMGFIPRRNPHLLLDLASGVSAVGLLLATATRAFVAWRHLSKGTIP